jgi:two-component sensor histidine kinase
MNEPSTPDSLNQRLVEQERSLLEANQRLQAIYNASAEGLTLCRALRDGAGELVDYQVIEMNKALFELTGATREDMLAHTVKTLNPVANPRWFRSAERVLKTGVMEHFDIRSPITGRWLNIRVSYVGPELFQQTFIDVTDRHLLEEQRRHLLKEMHHRVMNNFQMVAGFLHVQAMSAEAPARAHLQAAKSRVEVLAGLHATLMDANANGEIDMAAYISALCTQLRSMIVRPDAVTLAWEIEPLELGADKAVPIGFVVNELVTNALKYAFPEPRGGTITVGLRKHDDAWLLTIADDGVGLSHASRGDTVRDRGGLGTRLVAAFVHQLGAELTMTSTSGLRHEIRFIV